MIVIKPLAKYKLKSVSKAPNIIFTKFRIGIWLGIVCGSIDMNIF